MSIDSVIVMSNNKVNAVLSKMNKNELYELCKTQQEDMKFLKYRVDGLNDDKSNQRFLIDQYRIAIQSNNEEKKQLTDDIKKIKDIMSIFDYEPNDDDDHINKIKKIVDRY
eukprot:SAG22_NODE_7546_length_729_cov_2.830159_1_plen_111_part_00